MKIDEVELPTTRDHEHSVKIHNLCVKIFRSLLKKKSDGFFIFQVQNIHYLIINHNNSTEDSNDADLQQIKAELISVLTEELLEGLPPERNVDQKIEIEPGSTPPHRGIFQLSPAEFLDTKEYITDLLRKNKIRSKKSPNGAPPFFVKRKGYLRIVIYSRALQRITKHSNVLIPPTRWLTD